MNRLRVGKLVFRDPVLLCGVVYLLLYFDASGFLRLGLLAAFLHECGHILVYCALLRRFPAALWYVVGAIVLIRLASYGVAAWKYRTFASLHTYLNKLTGAAVFAVPFVLPTALADGYCWVVCIIAALASVEELILHLRAKSYDPSRKTLLRR